MSIYKLNVDECFFSVRLCRFCVVIRGFSSPPQLPMTSDFEGFSIPVFIHYIFVPILILEKEPVFPYLMFSAKQGNYLVPFYNVFGKTRSLTGDWTRDLPHSMPPLGYRGGGDGSFFKLVKEKRLHHQTNPEGHQCTECILFRVIRLIVLVFWG